MKMHSPFANFAPSIRPQSSLRQAITAAYRRSEAASIQPLLDAATLPPQIAMDAKATAHSLITALRAKHTGGGVDGLVQEYGLSSQEGVALMCLAEALLRIPDNATRDALIRDKIGNGDWRAHLGGGRSLFVNAATWGLVVTGKLVESVHEEGLSAALTRLIARAGEPVVRRGVDFAMRMMGEQFVTGETIEEALRRARIKEAAGFGYSFDMLGEAAMTAADAARYLADYEQAIAAIGKASAGRGVYAGPGISIKLSALHPRYSRAQSARVMSELLPRVKSLALMAKSHDIGLNIDAEEADRLEISLDLLESLALDPDLSGWDGLGFVVQAYGKRCPFVIDWVIDLARRAERRIMVRLVKGAYWDAEIKKAQVDGLTDFPVFTRKAHTDISYIACARKLLNARDAVFPQFATHNAQSLATIYQISGPDFAYGDYEFQCLHGMGEPLYDEVVGPQKLNRPCRIYAPVGTHETLLAYLVRRLLENGANSSFVNRISDPYVSIGDLIADPAQQVRGMTTPGQPHYAIKLPADIFGARPNSAGMDLSDEIALAALAQAMLGSAAQHWSAGDAQTGQARSIRNPAHHDDVVGTVYDATPELAKQAAARAAASNWAAVPVIERAACLERAADALQIQMPVLMGLIIREAGKSAPNAISEVREAIDFLRYYAAQARETLAPDAAPLGPVVCISPWNFPLAIFIGQVAAALAAGNSVLAKPAEETPLIAAQAVALLHDAGVPQDALQLITGDGAIGAALVEVTETQGVMFTGSTEVARLIQRQLATRLTTSGEPIPFIAETGGQNAMIADSSALAEQVVADVIASAFDSAGQRCSALRILCLQEEIADRTLNMLKGALAELSIGATDNLAKDIGPVITEEARSNINAHIGAMRALGHKVEQIVLPPECAAGTFVAPTLIELNDLADLKREIFGPVLHVIRYKRDNLDGLIDAINASGYGLTFGLHTRLDEVVAHVSSRIQAGNIYVNRNVIGAVVGVQPFGGRGLSGTGPKAGGPLYLGRLVTSGFTPSPIATASAAPAGLEFANWLSVQGEADLAAVANHYCYTSLLGGVTELVGPVGERNLYALHPRGQILLLPETRDGLLLRLSAALATGNRVTIADDAQWRAVLQDVPHAVKKQINWTANWTDAATKNPHSGVLIEATSDHLRGLLQEIADLSGLILITQSGDPRIELLVEEVSTSINVTAAGGNASLMTLNL
jgi:RHH-type transcriptional regulator, proline utilization regulon repressor / proline dehydrogenase / delta 1-pyrroline-5-carboxylate dehydrogenase